MNNVTVPIVGEFPEEMRNGVWRAWMYDRRIVVYKMTNATRSSIDTWADTMYDDAIHWPEPKPFLALHDIRHLAATPYARHRTIDVARRFPKTLPGRQATLISPTPLGLTIRLLGTQQVSHLVPNQDFEFFFDF